MLDIFRNNAFSRFSLTESINLIPFAPKRLGAMGLFETKNPTTNVVGLERKGGIISLIPFKQRGSGETTKRPATPRDMIPIYIPHVPYDDAVLAADVDGIRDFDSEDGVRAVSSLINEKMTGMRADHEATHEWHRINALKGLVIDPDAGAGLGTVVANLFTIMGLTMENYFFDLTGTGAGIKQDCIDIIRSIEDTLGGAPYDHIHAMCGNQFFDLLTMNEEVKEAYAIQTDAMWKIETQGQGTPGRGTSMIRFGDITFENYRGKVGTTAFIETDKAHFFPVGVPGLFKQYFGPAMTMSDVNQPGKDVYAMQAPMKFDEGMELHTESNPVMICQRPKLLIQGDAQAS